MNVNDLVTVQKRLSKTEGPDENLAEAACSVFKALAEHDPTCPPSADTAPLLRRALGEGSIDAVLALAAKLMPHLDCHCYVLDPRGVNAYLIQGSLWKFDGAHKSWPAFAFMDCLLSNEISRLGAEDESNHLLGPPPRYVPNRGHF